MSLKVDSLNEFANYCQSEGSRDNFSASLELAERWVDAIERLNAAYTGVVQENVLLGLRVVNNTKPREKQYWEEGDQVIYPFDVVMGAAEILCNFWVSKDDFVGFTKDAPYRNRYGNWVDPLHDSQLPEFEAVQLRRERLSA